MATCHKCKIYLYDTLPTCIKKELGLYDLVRQDRIYTILPEFTDWIFKVYSSIQYVDFCECWAHGRMFAMRTSSKEEDTVLMTNLSVYYQMKRFSSWLKEDVQHIHILLNESGVLKTKRFALYDELPEKYLGLIIPTLYLALHEIHEDHLHPEKWNKKNHSKQLGTLEKDEDLYT